MRKNKNNSIIDNSNYCIECGKYGVHRHHVLHGLGRRKLADEDGLIIPLCPQCHERLHSSKGHEMDLRYQRLGEMAYLGQGHSIEEFIERYGKNYL